MHGEAPAGRRRASIAKYRKRRSERVVGNDEVHGRTKKNSNKDRTSLQSWDHQPQEEGVLVVRDSLGCDEDAMMGGEVEREGRRRRRDSFRILFLVCVLRIGLVINDAHLRLLIFRKFLLTVASNETQKSMKDADTMKY